MQTPKKVASVSGKSKNGFTLIEIVVAILILGVMATIVVPNLFRQLPDYERQQFVKNLNTVTQLAYNNALTTGKIHRVVIDAIQKIITIEMAAESQDKKDTYVPLQGTYLNARYTFGNNIDIKNVYIEGEDQITKHGGGKKSSLETWFYIMSDGLSQAVVMNIIDTKNSDNPYRMGLVLNPFTAQFKEYDTFQKP